MQSEYFPWHLIDGMQIHEDSAGRLFTFFDLLAGAQLERAQEAIREKAVDAINTLRLLYTTEIDLLGLDVPEKWDDMDTMFRVWVRDRIMELDKRVAPEYKAKWEEEWNDK